MNLRPSGYEPDELPLLHPASRSQTITDLGTGVKLALVSPLCAAHLYGLAPELTSRNDFCHGLHGYPEGPAALARARHGSTNSRASRRAAKTNATARISPAQLCTAPAARRSSRTCGHVHTGSQQRQPMADFASICLTRRRRRKKLPLDIYDILYPLRCSVLTLSY